jgi:DNA-binding PadR family transcriptional regulator
MIKDCEANHPFAGYIGKDMRHIILKLVLIHRISKGQIYSYALINELNNTKISKLLEKKGMALKNDIYNTLSSLERSGYIKSKLKTEKGKVRNYYVLTQKGRKALTGFKTIFMKTMKEFINVMKE